jgi:membrane protein DedA with SNARE-associated domain
VTHQLIQHGLVLLFLAVAIESAGAPVPGETALIAAAVLASQGHYSLFWVIVVAAAGAIIGDNVGYWLGRVGGRTLLFRWSITRRHFEKVLPPAERFFRKHGGKTVFFGRFIAVLRVTAAWLAGITHMHWWQFLLWNAAGGIVWSIGVSTLAYYAGQPVADAVERYGLYAVVVLIVLGVIGLLIMRRVRARILEET